MKADTNHEYRFMSEVDALDFFEQDLEAILRKLTDRFGHLTRDLDTAGLNRDGLRDGSTLARQADAVNRLLKDSIAAWAGQWVDLQPAQALAHAFEDHAILLVFGTFNAGKSSFCNLLAERFATEGKAVGYFHLDDGRIVDTQEPFREGATETTARLQGVRLGAKLLLLDTPGLHSVTPDNAELTQRFTDSADCVLWLTSSAAPGQVQELEDLGRELARAKPLLPVVTRSDLYEEDEIDGALVKGLRNKTPQNRAQQEADVTARAQDKLAAMRVGAAQLKLPVSISVHMARSHGQTSMGMEEAGFERLYAALLAIVEPALAYKRRKPAETLLHHQEEHVLGTLRARLLPLLETLNAEARLALERLAEQQERIIASVWREVVPVLAQLLERHADTRAVDRVCEDLSQSLRLACIQAEKEHLADCLPASFQGPAPIILDDGLGFDELLVEEGELRQVVGVDYARLYAGLEKQLSRLVLERVEARIEQCRATILALMNAVAHLAGIVPAYERDLRTLKTVLRVNAG